MNFRPLDLLGDMVVRKDKLNYNLMKSYVEALLFATPEPLTQSQINGIFPGEDVDLAHVVDELNTEYENRSCRSRVCWISLGNMFG